MDRHRFAADPDPDPNFQVYAAPDTGTDWHQNMLENQNFFSFSHSIDSLQSFSLVSNVLQFSVFWIAY